MKLKKKLMKITDITLPLIWTTSGKAEHSCC